MCFFCGHSGTKQKEYIKIVVFVQLQRIYLILPLITWLRGRIEINALQVLLHTYMHTWAPSYNRTLPSIYQIVNGLMIDFYVDTHTYIYIDTNTHKHVLDMHTCMFVQCTQSTSALCYFFLSTKVSGWFSLQCKGCGDWVFPDEGKSYFLLKTIKMVGHCLTILKINVHFL